MDSRYHGECGDVVVGELLLCCSKCKNATRHRYRLDVIIFDSVGEQLCSNCSPKHNEANKSLDGTTNQRQPRNTQFSSSIIKEPNTQKEKLTIAWGLRRNRAHRKRNGHVDGSTKHCPSGDTSNRGRNRPRKERRDAITAQSCSGDALDSCVIFARDIPNDNDSKKEGEGRNGHLICTMESFDGSSNLALDHALQVEPNNVHKAMSGYKLASNSAECSDLSNVMSGRFVSLNYVEGLVPRGKKGAQTNDAKGSHPMQRPRVLTSLLEKKGSHPMIKDKSHPTSVSLEHIPSVNREKSERLKAIKGLKKSVVASKLTPNRSKLMQGSHLKKGNADILKPLKQRLDSWSRVPMQSSPSNELEDRVVQEKNVERTRGLADEVTVAPILKNGRSNPSMANERLVSNKGNSGEADRRSVEVLSSTIENMRKRTSVGREIVNSCKVNGISRPDSTHGDPDASIAGMALSLGVKKMILRRVLQEEGINRELLSSKFVGPCESAKINPRKRIQPDGIKFQNARFINENKNVIAARSKSSRPAPVASLRDCQNIPRKDSGSSNEVIGHSKKGKDKKMDKSWLARKTTGGSRRTGSVLRQRSSLQRSSVDKPITYSENMDLAPKESSCPLKNNPRGSCAVRVATISSTTTKLRDGSEPKKRRRLAEISSTAKELRDDTERKKRRRRLILPYDEEEDAEALHVAEISSTTTKELHDDSEPKKRRRLILPYDEEEDAEALHVVDLNSRSCDNDGHEKKQRKCVENAAKNPRRYVEEDEEAPGSGNLDHECSNYYKRVKKQTRIDATKDKNASVRNLNAGCAENNVSQLALQTGVTEDHSGILRMPLIPESTGAQPLDKPYWTGIMKMDKNYIPLSAHLSTKAGKKVQELSRSLPPIMKVTKISTLKSCPKHLEAPLPSADSIDLYFFCGDTRPNKELDQLVKHVSDSGIILEGFVGLAKLCLFPSFVLPEEYQTFEGKPYLWGVFNPKDELKRLAPVSHMAPVEQDCTAHVTEEDHVQEQRVLDEQDKAQGDTLDQVVRSENHPLLGANREVGKEALSRNVLPLVDMEAIISANISPTDPGQPSSNPEAPALRLCGFVVSRTPRAAQLIQEMQKEGALLFAVQQVVTDPGSLV